MHRGSARGIGCLAAILVFIVTSALIYSFIIYPWIAWWGASPLEAATAYPGDELVTGPSYRTTRAVSIKATPEQIYPWLVQMGVDRAGLYSVEWIENLLGLRVRNAGEVRPEWQGTAPGDFLRLTPVDYFLNPGPGLYVMSMDAPRTMVACFGVEGEPPTACPVTWQFILEPQAGGSTRLILRSNNAAPNAFAAGLGKVFQLPIWVMERAMLEGIKVRAEGTAQ